MQLGSLMNPWKTQDTGRCPESPATLLAISTYAAVLVVYPF
jgi:hypothetical protein